MTVSTDGDRARHWDAAYADADVRSLSWYRETPDASLELIEALGVARDAAVIDVGGGACPLVDHLVAKGFTDVSVLDVSERALVERRRRLGDRPAVHRLHEDVLAWRPPRRFDLWHDRAVLHFLIAPSDRDAYVQTLRAAIRDDGFVVIATFAPDGPASCSGLPVTRYSADDLCRLLAPGFELLAERREEHVTPRGTVQPFTWVAGRVRRHPGT